MTAKKTLRRHANGSFKPGQLPGILIHVKPKKKRIHSGIYSATVMEVDTWLIFRECLLSLGLVNRTLSLFTEALEGQIIEY